MKELLTAIIVYGIALCVIWVVVSPFIPDWMFPWRRKHFKLIIEQQKINLTGSTFAVNNQVVEKRLESAELGINQARIEGKFHPDGKLDLFVYLCDPDPRNIPENFEKLRQILIDCSYFAKTTPPHKN